MTNTRLDHTNCRHDATPAGRKACRTGDALIRSVDTHDAVTMNGTTYSVVGRYALTGPAEIRLAVYTADGWVPLGWMDASEVAKATKLD